MNRYQIEIKTSAKKELARLPRQIAEKVVERIKWLADNPRPDGCKKLRGEDSVYRIRVGDYRVVYSIVDQYLIIEVIRIRHRREVYKT
jgi:mRNA interferase RelE/StbE